MTYMPHVNMWAWNQTGEDNVFFSQPTMAWRINEGPYRLPTHEATARCPMVTQMGSSGASREAPLTDRAVWSYPIQCGFVATVAPDGSHVCDSHLYEHYICRVCGGYDADCTWIREFVICCTDSACLATCTAPPAPCTGCGTLFSWGEGEAGACWDCQRQQDGEERT